MLTRVYQIQHASGLPCGSPTTKAGPQHDQATLALCKAQHSPHPIQPIMQTEKESQSISPQLRSARAPHVPHGHVLASPVGQF